MSRGVTNNRKRFIRFLFFVLVLVVLQNQTTVANIIGSAHDFSGQGWSNGSICEVCHTPHNADLSITAGPLWNHEVTTAAFSLYSSSTLDAAVEQPTGVSKLCLSCHDGTVAMDSFGGNDGNSFISGSSDVGTDLTNDHPVSFRWEHQTVGTCKVCHDMPSNPQAYKVVFYDRRIECATCHDPHNDENESGLVRVTLAESQLCYQCHTDK